MGRGAHRFQEPCAVAPGWSKDAPAPLPAAPRTPPPYRRRRSRRSAAAACAGASTRGPNLRSRERSGDLPTGDQTPRCRPGRRAIRAPCGRGTWISRAAPGRIRCPCATSFRGTTGARPGAPPLREHRERWRARARPATRAGGIAVAPERRHSPALPGVLRAEGIRRGDGSRTRHPSVGACCSDAAAALPSSWRTARNGRARTTSGPDPQW